MKYKVPRPDPKPRTYALDRFRTMRQHGSWAKKVQYAQDFERVMKEGGVKLYDRAGGYMRKWDYHEAMRGVGD